MKKDRVFATKQDPVEPFAFTRQVAQVFDDMLARSVPLYRQGIRLQAKVTRQFYQAGTRIYDLGCSHGNLGMAVMEEFQKDKNMLDGADFTIVGVDNSLPMIEAYAKRLEKSDKTSGNIHLVCGGMEDIQIQNASVVIINLTLQFLAPDKRQELIKAIYQGLVPNGILLLTEKTWPGHDTTNELYQHYYEQFKRDNGYSNLEIAQKRNALEKVLIPDTIDTHFQRLCTAGFSLVDVWMKWFYFTSFMAIKTDQQPDIP